MSWFNSSFLSFLDELSRNNSSAWFNDHRKQYENDVKKPFQAFVQEMISRIRQHEPETDIKPSDAIMRINKDIRFSKDKKPYNTHVAANISPFGKKDKGYPGFYFQFSPEGIKVVGGAYMLEAEALQKVRNAIRKNHLAFKASFNDKSFKKIFKAIQGERNKRLSPEFTEFMQQEPMIANKQFYYEAVLDPSWITDQKLADQLMLYFDAGKPVNDFLRGALKEK